MLQVLHPYPHVESETLAETFGEAGQPPAPAADEAIPAKLISDYEDALDALSIARDYSGLMELNRDIKANPGLTASESFGLSRAAQRIIKEVLFAK